MEIKATLNNPYNEEQRISFIVEQNHQKGYEIKETEKALEAWGFTAEEIEQKAKEQRRKELLEELDNIDLKTIRALRAISAGTGTEADKKKLEDLEEQAAEIRQQLKELGA